ncbi:MAG: 7,8-dihydropterin-6-yl-methyl-4-(beta-D-ribofuranosyl)aminobenzene 5'-phosphate synthase [Candidatus Midichloriaceae bacterium]|jgi:7,8-dihydropterin-6-yl-methyl-4-(beta-D-ribofuranosyl)aminobenzene 5'-phosphate synthase
MIKVTTIYDNIECTNGFQADWGFGCIIDHPKAKIIFDTGAHHTILEKNLKIANIDPSDIDIIVLSHKHWDHKGGASWIAKQNRNVKIYMPKSWSNRLEKKLSLYTSQVHSVLQNLYLSDEFHVVVSKNIWIRELALVIDTSGGSLVFTGCSHTGIHNIIRNVQNEKQRKIEMLFGGFHLLKSSVSKINMTINELKKLNVCRVAPCHCTGKQATEILQKEYKNNFIKNGVGKQFIIPL